MKTLHSFVRFIGLIAVMLLGVFLESAAAGPTPISGTISTSRTWTTAGNPYILSGSVYVEGAGTPVLTINPGVIVQFNQNAELVISYNSPGALVAVGSAGSPIVFTANGSTTPGFWKGLYIGNKTPATATRISYATVEYGGWTANTRGGIHVWSLSPTFDQLTLRNNVVAGLTVNGGAPLVTNSTISSNGGNGIDVAAGAVSVSACTITGNTGYAISAAAPGVLSGLTGLTVSGNGPGKDLIERRAGTISASQTWVTTTIPYAVTGAVYVSGSPAPTLTIQPGVTMKFSSGAVLAVSYPSGGVLKASGTSVSKILFTANGSTAPGFWQGVYLGNLTATASTISYATVEYGGSTANARGGIHVEGSSPTLDRVTVQNNIVAGFSVKGGSPTITNSTLVTGNSGPGLLISAGSASVTNSTITNNTGYAISAAPNAVLTGLSGLTVSGNGPGKDLIERQAGTISASQTWVTTTIPYAVTGAVYVSGSPAPTLTIQPGVTMKFSSGAVLAVSYPSGGVLKASGTAASKILFTANGSTAPGFWHGVYLGNLTATASTISYATVEYGGSTAYARGGIHVEGSSPTLDRVTVQNNIVAGFSVNGGSPTITNSPLVTGNSGPGVRVTAGSPTISGSTISSNGGNGIDVAAGAVSVSACTITGNTGYAISAAGPGVLTGLTGLTVSGNGPGKDLIERRAGTISVSQTWVTTAIPYAVTGAVYVSGSPAPTLTIQPGVTMKFSSGAVLAISYPSGGVLKASGTSASKILFTANGSTAPGFWQGVYLGNLTATASTISYATVEYGGSTDNARGGIHVEGSSPTLDHVTMRTNLVAAITVKGGSPVITSDSFSGNPAGLINQLPASRITARLNYWGTVDGPSGSGPGTGQSVSAGVLFEPWLVAAPSSPQFFNSFSQKNRMFNPAIGINTTIMAGTAQSGTWQFRILDSGGTVLRSYSGSGTSGTVVWDGKNGATPPIDQPDGTYTYQLDSTAGGAVAATARGLTLLDRTKQLTISNLAVAPQFFSPNGDGVQDTTTVTGANSFDDTTLTVNVKNSVGSTVRTSSSSGTDLSYTWDGKNASAVVQPDGGYTFEVVATNGTASANSSITGTLDNTLPAATISAPTDGQVLSNVYTTGVTNVTVTGSATDLNFKNWSLDYGSGGSPTSFTALGSGTSAVTNATLGTWATAPPFANGLYTLRLQAWDQAGSRSVSLIKPTVGNFSVASNAYELNGTAGGTVTFTSTVPFALTETVFIKNAAGATVRTVSGPVSRTAGTYSDVWNGRNDSGNLLPDGPYFYFATATAGSSSMTWDLSAQMKGATATPRMPTATPAFDPFNNRPITLNYNLPVTSRVNIEVGTRLTGGPSFGPNCAALPADFACVVDSEYQQSGDHSFIWAGTAPSGAFLPNKSFIAVWYREDTFPKNAMVLFGTRPTLTNAAFSPAFYGPAARTQSLSFDVSSYQNAPVNVSVKFVNQGSVSALRTVTASGQPPGRVTVTWDGRADNGMWVAAGFYTAIITVTDPLGNVATLHAVTTVAY